MPCSNLWDIVQQACDTVCTMDCRSNIRELLCVTTADNNQEDITSVMFKVFDYIEVGTPFSPLQL